MTAIARITTKGQITIPRDIRTALHISGGDLIAWELETDGSVRVRRVPSEDGAYLHAVQETLPEWGGAADEAAYADL